MLDNLIEEDEFDLGFMYIVEAMLDYNHCDNLMNNGVFCDNVDNYLDGFADLKAIKRFFDAKNRKTCKDRVPLEKYQEEDSIRVFPCF